MEILSKLGSQKAPELPLDLTLTLAKEGKSVACSSRKAVGLEASQHKGSVSFHKSESQAS